jgi:hypothetical protein
MVGSVTQSFATPPRFLSRSTMPQGPVFECAAALPLTQLRNASTHPCLPTLATPHPVVTGGARRRTAK